MLIPNNSDIAASFDDQTVERGRSDWRDAKVVHCQWEDSDDGTLDLRGRVAGSGNRLYDVNVVAASSGGRIVFDGVCSCSSGFNCRHAVALVYAYLQLAAPPMPSPPTSTQDERQFDQWLTKVASLLEDPPPAPVAAKKTERASALIVVLKPGSGAINSPLHRVSASLFVAKALKGGGYNSGNQYSLHDLVLGRRAAARALTEADRLLLLRWRSKLDEYSAYSFDLLLDGVHSGALLSEMIATGRCYWINRSTPPLTLGAARHGALTWVVQPDGRQRPALTVTPAARVLSTQPLWYVDEERRECGPLLLPFPERAVPTLLAAPTLRVEQIPRLRERLAPWEPVLALPAATAAQRIAGVTPTPVLHLARINSAAHTTVTPDGRQLAVACAYLSFDYAGHRVDPRAHLHDTVLLNQDGVSYCVERQRSKETESETRLHRWYLRHLPTYRMAAPPNQAGMVLAPYGQELGLDPGPMWLDFVLTGVSILRAEGWRIEIDADFPYRVAAPPDEWSLELQETSDNRWFDFALGVQVDGKTVNLLPLLVHAIRTVPGDFTPAKLDKLKKKDFIPLRTDDGVVLPLPGARVRDILRVLVELYDPNILDVDGHLRLPAMRAADVLRIEKALGAAQTRWLGPTRLQELGARLQQFSGIREVAPPATFHATLRPYQQEGLNWLQFLRDYNLAGVLADDMGLGKTVQTLAHLAVEKSAGRMTHPTLIIAPTSLISNWRREAQRFAPELTLLVMHGASRKEQFERIPEHDLVLTTYPLLVRDEQALLAHEYYTVILDEAQYIKNPKAKATLVAQQLNARHRLCLTGTPMENHLGEVWSIFHFLMPGLLGDERRFARLFRTPIEKHGDTQRQHALRERIKPFLLRRTKDVVAGDLPPKSEIVRSIALDGAQRDLYETIRAAMQEKIKRAIESKGLQRSHIEILDALLKLRQVCCDPRLVKLEAARHVEQSAKLELLMDMLPELIAEGRRVLLFSQFTSMLTLIEREVARHKIAYTKLTGTTRDRAQVIARFDEGHVPLFLISLKAGGTGLNLTAADTVIHYDPWWNPAVERQATDRAHRIGQDKPVFVYKLLTEGTVEERMAEMQTRKQALADALLSGEGAGIAALQPDDLAKLFAPLA